MRINILTLFPEMFDGFLTNSIIKRALAKEVVEIKIINIRDFTLDKYRRVDTPPIGGGAGLIMKCQPIVDALKSIENPHSHKVLMSPKGKQFNQQFAVNFAKLEDLTIVCGHYEGVDERVSNYVDEEISIGDYVLTGGEIPAMVLIDSVARMLPGVVQDKSSVEQDSFYDEMLDYPQYTRPAKFKNMKVPDILLSGNHSEIEKWRKQQSYERTKQRRPDLLKLKK